MRRTVSTLLICALASAPMIGCSGDRARLIRDDGAVLVGRIVGGDEARIWVEVDEPRRRTVVQRDRLIDIEHPDAVTGGWVWTGLGALLAIGAVATGLDDSQEPAGFGSPRKEGAALIWGIVAATFLGIGIPTIVGGLEEKAASEAAASPEAGPPRDPPPTVEVGLTGLRVKF